MSTTRRKFLGSLAALMVAPFVALKAKTGTLAPSATDDAPALLPEGYVIKRSSFGPDFLAKMEKQLQAVVRDELIRQKRANGLLRCI